MHKFPNEDIINAHKHCTNNKKSLIADDLCGCFYCLKIFNPKEINSWIKDTKGTALCPYCEVDSVIGKKSSFSITKQFLKAMNDHWFNKNDLKTSLDKIHTTALGIIRIKKILNRKAIM